MLEEGAPGPRWLCSPLGPVPRPPCAVRPWPKSCWAWRQWTAWATVLCAALGGLGKLPGRHVRPFQHIPSVPAGRIAEVGRQIALKGVEAWLVLPGPLLFSLPSLQAAALLLSRPESGPGRSLLLPLSESLASPAGEVLGVSSEQLGLPHRHTRDLVLGAATRGLCSRDCPCGAQGPAGVQDCMPSYTEPAREVWTLGPQVEARAGVEGLPASLHPVAFGCMYRSPAAWISRWQPEVCQWPTRGCLQEAGLELGLGCGTDWRNEWRTLMF